MTVGVAIPTFPARRYYLARAIESVLGQTHPVDQISVSVDLHKEGAGPTRQRALEAMWTDWTAFLDDDDEFKPEHIEKLLACAEETGADMVFPWFDVVGGTDPFPLNEHREFDPADGHQTTITVLVRTGLAKEVGGFVWEPGLIPDSVDSEGNRAGEDYLFAHKIARAGTIKHLDERTWYWHHDSFNTSGIAARQPRTIRTTDGVIAGPVVGFANL